MLKGGIFDLMWNKVNSKENLIQLCRNRLRFYIDGSEVKYSSYHVIITEVHILHITNTESLYVKSTHIFSCFHCVCFCYITFSPLR